MKYLLEDINGVWGIKDYNQNVKICVLFASVWFGKHSSRRISRGAFMDNESSPLYVLIYIFIPSPSWKLKTGERTFGSCRLLTYCLECAKNGVGNNHQQYSHLYGNLYTNLWGLCEEA